MLLDHQVRAALHTTACVAGWSAAVLIPNTWGVNFMETVWKGTLPYYKDVKQDPETYKLYKEVFMSLHFSVVQ